MLTEDAIKAIVGTCQAAVVEDQLTPTREPSNVFYLLNRKTGEYERKVAPIYSNTTAETLASLVDQSLTLATETEEYQVKVFFTPGNNTQHANYPSAGAVIVSVIDNNTITQQVPHSDQFLTLQAWAANKSGHTLTQGELYTYLRTQFFGCLVPENANLVDIIKTLDFTSQQAAKVELQSQKTSVSRKLMAEVTSNGVPIPETFAFEIPVYRGAFSNITARILIALIVDAEQSRFKLYVLPNQIDAAIEQAAAVIGNRLTMQIESYGDSTAVVDVVVSAGEMPKADETKEGEEKTVIASPTIFSVYRGSAPALARNGKA